VVIEEHTQIAAPVARVWALVSDPDRMSVLSPEVHHIDWTGELGGELQDRRLPDKRASCDVLGRCCCSLGLVCVATSEP
jgi:hypothetical protein